VCREAAASVSGCARSPRETESKRVAVPGLILLSLATLQRKTRQDAVFETFDELEHAVTRAAVQAKLRGGLEDAGLQHDAAGVAAVP
jgi:hypothetical protein